MLNFKLCKFKSLKLTSKNKYVSWNDLKKMMCINHNNQFILCLKLLLDKFMVLWMKKKIRKENNIHKITVYFQFLSGFGSGFGCVCVKISWEFF